jgi:hypothetical protein
MAHCYALTNVLTTSIAQVALSFGLVGSKDGKEGVLCASVLSSESDEWHQTITIDPANTFSASVVVLLEDKICFPCETSNKIVE